MTIRTCPARAGCAAAAEEPPMTDERSVRDRWHGTTGLLLVGERAPAGAGADVAEETA